MVKRAFKKFMFTAIQWSIMLAAIHCVATFLTAKSLKLVEEEEVNKQLNTETTKDLYQQWQESINIEPPRENVSEPANTTNVTTDPPIMELCPEISFPSHLLPVEDWQPVDWSRSTYAFSAYYTKLSHKVYIIGVRPKNMFTIICQLWGGKKGSTPILFEEMEAKLLLTNYGGFKYTSVTFVCPLDSVRQPTHVSLVKRHCDNPINVLHVQSATKVLPLYERRLTVCLAPSVSNFESISHLINWVEINKLLGVDKFVVYNYTSSDNSTRVLQHYALQGLIEVVQWRPPMVISGLPPEKRPVELSGFGETVALNDCLFRNKMYSEFIANIGINEYIVPHFANNESVSNIVNNLGTKASVYYLCVSENGDVISKSHLRTHVIINDKEYSISKMLIRTFHVVFTLPRIVPGVRSFIIPPEQIMMYIFPGIEQNQTLVSVFDNALPRNLLKRAQISVAHIGNKIGYVRNK